MKFPPECPVVRVVEGGEIAAKGELLEIVMLTDDLPPWLKGTGRYGFRVVDRERLTGVATWSWSVKPLTPMAKELLRAGRWP